MQLPTSPQVNAALRYVGTAAGTAVSVFAVLGVLDHDQATAVVDGVRQFTDGMQQAIGGLYKVIVIVVPIAVFWLGKIGVSSASLHKLLTAITANPDVKIEGKIVVPAPIANAVPSDKVVAK